MYNKYKWICIKCTLYTFNKLFCTFALRSRHLKRYLTGKKLSWQHCQTLFHTAFIGLQRMTLFWDIFRNFPQHEKRLRCLIAFVVQPSNQEDAKLCGQALSAADTGALQHNRLGGDSQVGFEANCKRCQSQQGVKAHGKRL